MLEFRPVSTFLGPYDGNVHRNFNPYFKHSEISQLKIKKETKVAVDRSNANPSTVREEP